MEIALLIPLAVIAAALTGLTRMHPLVVLFSVALVWAGFIGFVLAGLSWKLPIAVLFGLPSGLLPAAVGVLTGLVLKKGCTRA